jgi:hypothetical protein
MQEVFRKHLQLLRKEAYQVKKCRIFGIRNQPDLQRYIVQYVLRLTKPGTERAWNQWLTGVMYATDRTRWIRAKLWLWWMREKLRRPELRRGNIGNSPAFAPFYYIPDLKMLVQVFPYDPELPALPLLMAGPPPELEPLLLDRFGPGDWQTEMWEVEPVRYLVEMRATLRLTVQARDETTGRIEERRFYAKVYHDEEQGEQTYQVLRTLWDKVSAEGERFMVGRPIAYLTGLGTLIQEEVTGISLQYMLRQGSEMTPAVRRVARALAALHLDPVIPTRRRPLQREIAILERTKEHIQEIHPHLRSEVEEIVDAVVTGLEEVSPAPTHCDLSPGHIMFDGDRLVLLDLDEFAGADPMLDVARVLASVANAPLRYPIQERDHVRAAARAFVEEYFSYAPETWRARLPLHYAIAVLKMAGTFSRRQGSGTSEKVETLLKEAQDSLAGKGW